MSIEFSSQGGDDDDADQLAAAAGQKILHARGLCATLAKVISEIIAAAAEVSSSSHFSNFYTHENKALMHKCQKMIREEGNTEEILNASHLLKNIISLYYNNQSLSSPQARLEKKSISSLWMPCIKQVLTHADFLRSALQIKGNNVALSSMDKVINDHRIQLYESATGLLDLVCTQSFIEGIINSMEEADEMVSVAMHFSPSLSQIYRLLIHLISTSSQSSDQDNQIKRLDELLSRSIHFTGRLVLHYTSKVEVGTDMSTSNRHGLIRSLVEISACSNYTGKQRTESTTTTTTTHYRVIELNCKQVALNLLRQMGSHAIIDKAPHVGTVQQLWSATHHDQYYYYSPSSSQTMVLNRKCSLDWDRFIDNVYV